MSRFNTVKRVKGPYLLKKKKRTWDGKVDGFPYNGDETDNF